MRERAALSAGNPAPEESTMMHHTTVRALGRPGF
jgi:hypothetical protein